MTSVFFCVGILLCDPKRSYTKKNNIEKSFFVINVKRNDNSNKYDSLSFIAYGELANFINNFFHDRDVISVLSRPETYFYKDENGKQKKRTYFRAREVNYICHKSKLLLNKFGGNTIEEFPDIKYFLE